MAAWASDWTHQLVIVFASLGLALPFAVFLRRGFARERADASKEETVLRAVVATTVWPLVALLFAAVGLALIRRIQPEFVGEGAPALSILGFLLLFRATEQLLLTSLPPSTRRRRLRRLLLPSVFGLLVLQQVGLLGPAIAVMKRPLIVIGDDTVISAMSIVLAVSVVVGASIAGRLLQGIIGSRLLNSFGVETALAEALAAVTRYLLVVIGFLWGLDLLGFDLSTIKVLLGALGVGIGFGLQNIVNNFVSGLILLFERSVKRGDVLTVQGTDAKVQHVGLRASVIRSREGDDLIMPNSMLVENIVTNYSFHDRLKRIDVAVGVSYGADPKTVEEVLLGAAAKCEGILDRPLPSVLFMDFGESSIDFSLRVWVDDAWTAPIVRSELLFDVWYALTEAGIEIPFPQRDLHLRSGELPIRKMGEA